MSKKEMYAVECEIEVAFARLIGPLAIMNELETYKNIHEELLDLFHVIVKWGTRFQIEKNLDFITPNEIIEIYNRMDKIKEDYLYDNTPGNELSDEIVIWMYEIKKKVDRNERKKFISNKKEVKVTNYNNRI